MSLELRARLIIAYARSESCVFTRTDSAHGKIRHFIVSAGNECKNHILLLSAYILLSLFFVLNDNDVSDWGHFYWVRNFTRGDAIPPFKDEYSQEEHL